MNATQGYLNVKNELEAILICIKSNASIVMVPGIIILCKLVTMSHYDLSKLVLGIFYLFLFILTFDLSNQINGIEEDIINKPERPLASGYWSIDQAWNYLIIFSFTFASIAWFLNVFSYSLAWIIISLFHNFLGHKYWYLKNHVSLTIGSFILIASVYSIFCPIDQSSLREFIVVALAGGISSVTQDLRDLDGDKIIGRRTLPIIFGEAMAVRITAISLIVGCSIFDIYFFMDGVNSQLAQISFFTIVIVQLLNLIVLLLAQEQKSYKLVYDIFKINFILYVLFLMIKS